MACRPAHRASAGSAQFRAFLQERLLLPVSEETADECNVRFQLDRTETRNDPDSFSAILKERLLLPLLVKAADDCKFRLQLNRKDTHK